MMKKLFIFDFDGTIADTKPIMLHGLLEYLKEENLSTLNIDLICNNYAAPDNHDFGWGVDKKMQREIMDKAFINITEKITNNIYIPKIFEEIEKIIKKLYNEGHTLTICTSREKRACDNVLKYYNLDKYFKIIKTRDDVTLRNKKPKPDPELILEIIEETNFSKENCFIIGDTDGDIFAGKNANIQTIAVSWGYFDKEQLRNLNPTHLIENLNDFLNIL